MPERFDAVIFDLGNTLIYFMGDWDKVIQTGDEELCIRRVRVEWTGGPKTENGAYGLYPMQSENVLLESNVVIGSSDAGVYVGQSKNVVVRNNRAEYNVAGIEIENTFDADVYDNVATNNTGGILVFNMPNLSQPGARTRVFRNQVFENNTKNFGVPGPAVAGIPAGSDRRQRQRPSRDLRQRHQEQQDRQHHHRVRLFD